MPLLILPLVLRCCCRFIKPSSPKSLAVCPCRWYRKIRHTLRYFATPYAVPPPLHAILPLLHCYAMPPPCHATFTPDCRQSPAMMPLPAPFYHALVYGYYHCRLRYYRMPLMPHYIVTEGLRFISYAITCCAIRHLPILSLPLLPLPLRYAAKYSINTSPLLRHATPFRLRHDYYYRYADIITLLACRRHYAITLPPRHWLVITLLLRHYHYCFHTTTPWFFFSPLFAAFAGYASLPLASMIILLLSLFH